MEQLNKKIEELRSELDKKYGAQDVLEVSQELDNYIVEFQKTFYSQKPPPGLSQRLDLNLY